MDTTLRTWSLASLGTIAATLIGWQARRERGLLLQTERLPLRKPCGTTPHPCAAQLHTPLASLGPWVPRLAQQRTKTHPRSRSGRRRREGSSPAGSLNDDSKRSYARPRSFCGSIGTSASCGTLRSDYPSLSLAPLGVELRLHSYPRSAMAAAVQTSCPPAPSALA